MITANFTGITFADKWQINLQPLTYHKVTPSLDHCIKYSFVLSSINQT